MELREFAERVLLASTLPEKLITPEEITDEEPGVAIASPEAPGRPPELRFKPSHSAKVNVPGLHDLERGQQRGRLLHFFANHELLAAELMALVLLRFPEAPAAFRRAVLQTLRDEQEHTRWYLRRMKECGVAFGEIPLSGYFWRAVSPMDTPADYVTGLSLTFEQANLDFASFYARGFAQAGDLETSQLLRKIYQDEIGHVACGLKWFRKWKDPRQTDWEAFRQRLRFPLSPQRAKGPDFNVAGRLAAGLGTDFIDELKVFAQSKGRTPSVFVFNPFAEGYISEGKAFTPNKHQQLLQQDLENLPEFLCRQDDVVLVQRRPALGFLSGLKETGFAIPEFIELTKGRIGADTNLNDRKLAELRPWAWGPDSQELLRPLFCKLKAGSRNSAGYHESQAKLYSKEWSASLLRTMLSRFEKAEGERCSWICTADQVGLGVSTLDEALSQIESIRRRGHHRIVVKDSMGVAGHNAIRLLEPEVLDTQWRWMARAFQNGRRLVLEPWLERVADFSAQLEMEPAGLKLVGYSGLLNDWKGQYQGNWAGPGFQRRIGLDLSGLFPQVQDIASRMLRVYSEIFRALEKELREAGYFGPVGIDAFVYKTAGGECRLKPVVEINPRYTMGRLTLELMHNVAPGSTGTFRLINTQRVKSDRFEDFASWAGDLCKRMPVARAGDPIPKIVSGAVCLNDPGRAQVCLAIFEVTRQTKSLKPPMDTDGHR